MVVHIDHVDLCYLMAKKDVKPRLIRWVMLLQEFNFEVKDRKVCENQVADHLSRLEREQAVKDELEINESFPGERVLAVVLERVPQYVDFAIYVVSEVLPNNLSFQYRKKFLRNVREYF